MDKRALGKAKVHDGQGNTHNVPHTTSPTVPPHAPAPPQQSVSQATVQAHKDTTKVVDKGTMGKYDMDKWAVGKAKANLAMVKWELIKQILVK